MIALEWGRFGITANALAPMIGTPMYEGVRASMTPAQLAEHDSLLAATMPIGGRLGVAERDLAPPVRFLMGEGSRYITGQTFSVDGGMVMVR